MSRDLPILARKLLEIIGAICWLMSHKRKWIQEAKSAAYPTPIIVEIGWR
jgi:hypothetical protein